MARINRAMTVLQTCETDSIKSVIGNHIGS